MDPLTAMLLSALTHLLAANYQPGFVEELVTDQLQQPTSVAVAPDGRIFISEKGGTIRIIEQGTLLSSPFLSLEVDTYGERGISSILLDDDFDNTGYIYVYYNVRGTEFNRISRFTANGNSAVPSSEFVLMELDPLLSTVHNGGAMRWGQDGKLYITTGDGARNDYPQRMTNVLGKVLRAQ